MELLVALSDPMADVPAVTRVHLLKMLQEVAASLAEVPMSSAVWLSLEAAPTQLDLEGWRFLYTISRDRSRLVVIEHRELKDGVDPIARRKRSLR